MKRTELQRRTPLRPTGRLQRHAKPRPPQADQEARAAWKRPRWGVCENCGDQPVTPLHGHHVLARQRLAALNLSQWDERNRMDLCSCCHFNHEYGQVNRKISRAKLPLVAVAFVYEVLGLATEDYLRRYYDCTATAPEEWAA